MRVLLAVLLLIGCSASATNGRAPAGYFEPVCEAWHLLRGTTPLEAPVSDDRAAVEEARGLLDSAEPWEWGGELVLALHEDATAILVAADATEGIGVSAIVAGAARLETLQAASGAHSVLKPYTGFQCN